MKIELSTIKSNPICNWAGCENKVRHKSRIDHLG
jgi:hypothetical protein